MFFEGAISADSHIVEPPNCYVDHIEPKFRDIAPRIVRTESRGDAFVMEGMKRIVPIALLDGAGRSVSELKSFARTATFEDCRKSGHDPRYRVADQERDGLAAEILYASVGMAICTHPEPEYKSACMVAYNRWLEGFCAEAPNRLFGLGMSAVTSIDSAIEDFKRIKEQGFVGVMMPGNPVYEDYDHPDYDALWACATDLSLPLCFHILTAKEGDMRAAFNPTRGHRINGFMQIIRAVQDVIGVMVLGGVFERFPALKLVCAEGDAGWMPHYMYRMDHAAFNNAEDGVIKGLSKVPSAYLKSNVFMTFQDDWVAFKTRDLMAPSQLLWANDFPHTDSTWPNSQSLLAEHAADLSPEETRGILRDNVRRLFDLPLA
jgi:predicted TIM-barrel fold metal-dependent hydrolase